MMRIPDKHPSLIAGMFDAIAPRYDLLNHTLSVGLDRRWRSQAVAALALRPGARVIDICTGTADLAIAIANRVAGSSIVGIDFAAEMLRRADIKVRLRQLHRAVRLIRADATRLPLADCSCDAATIAFGIRNVAQPAQALAEISRVIRPGGRLVILEFGEPRIPGVRSLYAGYFRYVLPLVGRLISRHRHAYSYLPASVATFPPPAELVRTIATQGFQNVTAVPLTFGIVYLYVADK